MWLGIRVVITFSVGMSAACVFVLNSSASSAALASCAALTSRHAATNAASSRCSAREYG